MAYEFYGPGRTGKEGTGRPERESEPGGGAEKENERRIGRRAFRRSAEIGPRRASGAVSLDGSLFDLRSSMRLMYSLESGRQLCIDAYVQDKERCAPGASFCSTNTAARSSGPASDESFAILLSLLSPSPIRSTMGSQGRPLHTTVAYLQEPGDPDHVIATKPISHVTHRLSPALPRFCEAAIDVSPAWPRFTTSSSPTT